MPLVYRPARTATPDRRRRDSMERGFFRSLFDISFTSFITTKIIKFVYVITLVLVAITALVFVIAAFQQDTTLGIVTLLIGAPLASLIYVVYARLVLELIVQIFRITELLRDQNRLQSTAFSAAGWLPGDVPPPPQIGSPVTPEATTEMPTDTTTTPAQCPECGAVPTPGAAFCRNCGHRFA